jgi:endoglucanase
MNEPYGLPTRQWLDAANAAIAAIRRTGAKNTVLVPGNYFSGAHSWVRTDNDEIMKDVIDPLNNWMYDVHQYLDSDSSGSKPTIVSPTIGSERLKSVTEWCRANKKRAFLGEFAAAAEAGELGRDAVADMLTYMEANRDVWVGFAWWAAGSRWGNYMFSIEPSNMKDRPQMEYLRPHLQEVKTLPLPKPTK